MKRFPITGLFILFLLHCFNFSSRAQNYLSPASHAFLTPLKGSVFAVSFTGKFFNYSSSASTVNINVPYTLSGDSVAHVFTTKAEIPEEERHTSYRTLFSLEYHSPIGIGAIAGMSIYHSRKPYGFLGNYDFFQLGINYTLGVNPERRSWNFFGGGAESSAYHPWIILVPGVTYFRRDKDYYAGVINNINGRDISIDGNKVNPKTANNPGGTLDSLRFTYAEFNHLMRFDLGLWFLFHRPDRYDPQTDLRINDYEYNWLTMRITPGYDVFFRRTENMYALEEKGGAYIQRFFNKDVSRWTSASDPVPFHHFDGFSIEITLLFTFSLD